MANDRPEPPLELVASFRPARESTFVALNVLDAEHWRALRDELLSWHDPHGAAGDRVGTITLEIRPAGYVAALPEFEGW